MRDRDKGEHKREEKLKNTASTEQVKKEVPAGGKKWNYRKLPYQRDRED
jgi:hypothetical protein